MATFLSREKRQVFCDIFLRTPKKRVALYIKSDIHQEGRTPPGPARLPEFPGIAPWWGQIRSVKDHVRRSYSGNSMKNRDYSGSPQFGSSGADRLAVWRAASWGEPCSHLTRLCCRFPLAGGKGVCFDSKPCEE